MHARSAARAEPAYLRPRRHADDPPAWEQYLGGRCRAAARPAGRLAADVATYVEEVRRRPPSAISPRLGRWLVVAAVWAVAAPASA